MPSTESESCRTHNDTRLGAVTVLQPALDLIHLHTATRCFIHHLSLKQRKLLEMKQIEPTSTAVPCVRLHMQIWFSIVDAHYIHHWSLKHVEYNKRALSTCHVLGWGYLPEWNGSVPSYRILIEFDIWRPNKYYLQIFQEKVTKINKMMPKHTCSM